MDKYPFKVCAHFGTEKTLNHSFETIVEALDCYIRYEKQSKVTGLELLVVLKRK